MSASPSADTVFDRVAIIGFGNLGSSIARAVRKFGAVAEVVACDVDAAVLERARELGLADAYVTDPAAAVAGVDLVVICTPVGTYATIARMIAPHLAPGAVVTDVGSVKQAVIHAIRPHMPKGAVFVPGHPIAGSEKSGPDAGSGDLFEGRFWILTPESGTDPDAVTRITTLWARCGAIVETMSADYHDKVLAVTSHLPHLIAYTIVGTAFDLEGQEQRDVIRFSAGGFRDFTRLAGSSPEMWRDVFLNNRESVLEMLQRFTEDLTYLQRAIRWGEGDKLFELFARTRGVRRDVIEAKQSDPFPEGDSAD
ncbi:MAG: prephenate/arogenate dehydrogenase family protein [Alphaproteobacteria bacterium]|nr:prephenate/arogenate dehydrogenase family protein [Alphaproteobacteria bacterium]